MRDCYPGNAFLTTARELLRVQTANSHGWILKLIDRIPQEKWGRVAEGLNTSLKWQIGHLILSQHSHSVAVIVGPQQDILEKVPVKVYSEFFVFGDRMADIDERFPAGALSTNLRFMQEKGLWAVDRLPDDELTDPLFPRPAPHPVAKNKLEALSWNTKHNMWHCGQIGMLARAFGQPFDFKLKELRKKVSRPNQSNYRLLTVCNAACLFFRQHAISKAGSLQFV